MDKSIKIFLVLLLVLISLLILGGCEKPGNAPGVKDPAAANTGEQAPLYPDVDYSGENFTILVSGRASANFFNDFAADETSASVLDTAVYNRNTAVEAQFGVKIITIEDQLAVPKARNLIMQNHITQENLYDASMLLVYDVSVLAYSSYLYDMNSLPTIDLTKSWWDQKANNDLNLRGIVFFTTGDFSVWANSVTSCIAFNKELAVSYKVPDFYDLVKTGKWTIDSMADATKMVSDDLDANNIMDRNDLYGITTWDDSIYAIINGAGEKCCTINSDGDIILTLNGDRVLAAIEKYMGIYNQKDYVLNFQRTGNSFSSTDDAVASMFGGNRSLMLMLMFKNLDILRDSDLEYGIIPYPKLNEIQENYFSTVAPWQMNFICVPYMIKDEVKSGTIVEALCYESAKYVKPAYYEKTLVGRTVRDDESVEMLNVIFGNRVFDIGYFYKPGNISEQLLKEIIRKGSSDWSSIYATYESPANAQLETINQYFKSATEVWK